VKYVVAAAAEIPPGDTKIVEVARRSIGIFNINGELFALRNRCPHMGARLCEGRIWGSVESSVPGQFDYKPNGEVLTCPHHGWEFQIRTGRSRCEPEKLRAATYPVGIEVGRAILEHAADDARVGYDCSAISVPMRPEATYVVLDLHL